MQFSPSTQRQQSPERRLSPERRQEILKSRIPQPTFHSARRSVHESIRAVRYNPMDRLAASLDAGQVNSSSNWPFKADSSFSKIWANNQNSPGKDAIPLVEIRPQKRATMPIEVCTSGSSNGSEGVRVSNVFCREFPSASIDALAGETQIAIPCATCSYTSEGPSNDEPAKNKGLSSNDFETNPRTPRSNYQQAEPDASAGGCQQSSITRRNQQDFGNLKPEKVETQGSASGDARSSHPSSIRRPGRFSRLSTRLSNFFTSDSFVEELRKGPVIRHPPLELISGLEGIKNAERLPKNLRELWGLDRLEKMLLACLLLLVAGLISSASSITAVVMSNGDDPSRITMIAWMTVSISFVMVLALIVAFGWIHYRKTSKTLVDDELWIQVQRRDRPLPPLPQDEDKKNDETTSAAWTKFAADQEQLRRYVERLESRVAKLENQESGTSQSNDEPNALDNGSNSQCRSIFKSKGKQRLVRSKREHNASDDDNTATKPKNSLKESLSRRELLKPDSENGSSSENEGSHGFGIPRSDTKVSILTELCEAVAESYSPLNERGARTSSASPAAFGSYSQNEAWPMTCGSMIPETTPRSSIPPDSLRASIPPSDASSSRSRGAIHTDTTPRASSSTKPLLKRLNINAPALNRLSTLRKVEQAEEDDNMGPSN
ncbi:uncharacterized protein CTHT_0046420 [Thermochaetoides thermophila DSM 1495]|uniref:Uncharacterized protein n=1 Tax=Chaetomium thermophilum (strain DSM 1495 / CBS 144.50 / IMI 039719) TaxID=759272 RepID=G0S9M4_CHATD|nr:hypothetical protein CTHT_0046420 [Thermochaetoides thermophila DSM 1495]EGS20135.1 hypothetical protein CTHT_0046420 [Thermochaetoides thermophila DSM 1495]